jgi:hypothetical protein
MIEFALIYFDDILDRADAFGIRGVAGIDTSKHLSPAR